MTTLLTGGTGLLGAHLARQLSSAGVRPRLLVREGSNRRALSGVARDEVLGDITDPASLPQALDGIETVYHLAGILRFDPHAARELHRVHVEGTRNLLEAARKAGVRRVVHVSTIAAVGHGTRDAPATEDLPYNFEGDNPYHESKRQGEQVALSFNSPGRFEVVVANPTYVLGAYDVRPSSGKLLIFVARGLVHFYPTGGNNFVNAADVAQGLRLLMERGRAGERYILGGDNLTYRELLTLAAEEAGVAPPRLPAPGRLLRMAGKLGDLVGGLSPELFEQVNTPLIQSIFVPAYASSLKAEKELGYRPGSVRRAVREAFRWFQEEGYLPRTQALTPQGTLAEHG